MGRRHRNLNLGNILVILLTVALALSLWIPYGTARRVARVERHATQVATILLHAGRDRMPIDFAAPQSATEFERELRRRCRAAGHPESTLPEKIDPPTPATDEAPVGFWFRAKHFLFLLAPTPPDLTLDDDAQPPPLLEVYAWPRRFGAGHSAFFFAEEPTASGSTELREVAFYSRNLDQGYAGMERAPRAGAARRREALEELDEPAPVQVYRGRDDQRWIPLVVSTQKNSNK